MWPNQPEPNVEFIRTFFCDPEQEKVAVRLAVAIAAFVGERVSQLRPETKVGELIRWADSLSGVEIIMTFEEILDHEIPDDFAEDLEERTFRELVEYVCDRGRAGPRVGE